MSRTSRVGILAVGMLIALALGSAACSGQTPSTTTPAEPAISEVVDRNIKVFESPT